MIETGRRGRLRAPGSGLRAVAPSPQPPAQSSLQTAFSLVEVVISLAILSVGIVGAMRVFPVGLRASQRSELNSRATIAAQQALESIKLESCDHLVPQETKAEEFLLTLTIHEPSPQHLTDPNRLKAVDVTVGWSQDGRPRTLTFVTYVRCPTS